jgi:hypothetical protein
MENRCTPLERRQRAGVADHLFGFTIDFDGRDAGLHETSQILQHKTDQPAGCAHLVEFFL